MSDRDKELVTLKCNTCSRSFTLSYGRYRRFPKDHKWLCKDCVNIKRKMHYANLTPEQRILESKKRSEGIRKYWDNISREEYEKRSASQKNRWAILTAEEKELLLVNFREGHKLYMSKPETREKIREYNKRYWENLSDEERLRRHNLLVTVQKDYWNSLTEEEKYIKMSKLWNGLNPIGPTEYIFNSDLKEIGLVKGLHYEWSFNTYPFIHPDYYDKFGKINPITKEENFPYHSWDFIIYAANPNIKSIIIDIDGSAHNKDSMLFKRQGNDYTDREKIDYNDSQRPYQIPDHLDAYIIKSPDDKLNEDCVVINVKTNNEMKYSDLIKLIKNITDLTSSTIDQL